MKTDYSLLRHNTFGIEARAAYFAQYHSEQELLTHLQFYRAELNHLPLLLIGQGSNLLFLQDFSGLILHSAIKMTSVVKETDNDVLLRVGSGMTWDNLVEYAINNGMYGIENLSAIPGEVGAAAVQNIGAYGSEVKDSVESVECISIATGEKRVFHRDELAYGYRRSILKGELRGQYAVTYVTFRLNKTFRPQLEYGGIRSALQEDKIEESKLMASQLRTVISNLRKRKLPDPQLQGNAGSFYMNPIVDRTLCNKLLEIYPDMPHYHVDEDHEKIPAGWLIEQSGWKGRSMGPAGVSERQALVLVNLGGATGTDILRLSDAVCQSVEGKFGIRLIPEVNFI